MLLDHFASSDRFSYWFGMIHQNEPTWAMIIY